MDPLHVAILSTDPPKVEPKLFIASKNSCLYLIINCLRPIIERFFELHAQHDAILRQDYIDSILRQDYIDVKLSQLLR